MIDKSGKPGIFKIFVFHNDKLWKCTREIQSRFAMANVAVNKKKDISTRKCSLNLRKKILNFYILSSAL
jgi:hypothetical protein